MTTNNLKQAITYKQLNPAKQEIRLLELAPASNIEDRVVCRLVTVPLRDDLEFIALSSLYGDSNVRENILVNNKSVTITSHHAGALKHLRAVFFPTISHPQDQDQDRRRGSGGRAPPRWLRHLLKHASSILPLPELEGQTPLRLWLDVLCINQLDHQEKQNQVLAMSRIYGSAKMVIGWLGLKSDTSDAGLSVMKEIEDAMPPNWGLEDDGDKELNPKDYAPYHQWARKIEHIWQDSPDGTPAFMGDHWVGANDFMNRPYFQRRWILEEIALASFPAFLIGDTIVSWKQVLRLNRFMEEFKDTESDLFPPRLRAMVADLPLGTIHALLDEFVRRRKLDDAMALATSRSSQGTAVNVLEPSPTWDATSGMESPGFGSQGEGMRRYRSYQN